MNLFEKCKTVKEVNKKYRELALKLHPDKKGDTELFVLMKEHKELRLKELSAPPPTQTSESKQTTSRIEEKTSIPAPPSPYTDGVNNIIEGLAGMFKTFISQEFLK